MPTYTATAEPAQCNEQQVFVSFRVPRTLVNRAEERAQREDRSRSALLRRALSKYVEEDAER